MRKHLAGRAETELVENKLRQNRKHWTYTQYKVHSDSYHRQMCSHYQALKSPERWKSVFGVQLPLPLEKTDLWPGYEGAFVRNADAGSTHSTKEAVTGLFGLVPHWAESLKICRSTFNARSETVGSKPSFRDAWRTGKRCIIPAEAIFEPDWRSGKAISTRITRRDEQPMGIAGLWSSWRSLEAGIVHSFTMLTINADKHELMNKLHKPTDEKRMVVILPESDFDAWLTVEASQSSQFLLPYPAELLRADNAMRPTTQ